MHPWSLISSGPNDISGAGSAQGFVSNVGKDKEERGKEEENESVVSVHGVGGKVTPLFLLSSGTWKSFAKTRETIRGAGIAANLTLPMGRARKVGSEELWVDPDTEGFDFDKSLRRVFKSRKKAHLEASTGHDRGTEQDLRALNLALGGALTHKPAGADANIGQVNPLMSKAISAYWGGDARLANKEAVLRRVHAASGIQGAVRRMLKEGLWREQLCREIVEGVARNVEETMLVAGKVFSQVCRSSSHLSTPTKMWPIESRVSGHGYQVTRIKSRVSSHAYRVTRIKSRVSSHAYQVTRIESRVSNHAYLSSRQPRHLPSNEDIQASWPREESERHIAIASKP
jgi:hypothetical protein